MPLGERVPCNVVPQMDGRHRRGPPPTQFFGRRHVGSEPALGLAQARHRCLIAVAEERRQPVEQQVDPARRLRGRRCRSRSPCYLQCASARAGQAAREPCCYQCLQICFACETGIEVC